jgi:hypothetical protein
MRCTFDGETLRFVERGNVLRNEVPRGFCEPSLTFFDGKYYLTLRNDVRAYVSVSEDGLQFDEPTPWVFDDGKDLGSYNTQAHWVTHSDGLFLAYTRRGADNDHIVRNRAPLFIGRVDTEKRCIVRDSERVLVPERGAMLGNFGASAISETESWVTVGEGMYKDAAKHGAEGCVFVARVKWSKPNRLLDRLR